MPACDRKAVEVEPLEQLDLVALDGLPVEREVEVARELRADVLPGGDRVEGALELLALT